MKLSEPQSKVDSFENVYSQYYKTVAATVYKFKFTDGAADDIIQDVFIQAWQSLSSLRDPKAMGGWIRTIARNKCLNEIRKKKPTVSVAGTDAIDSDTDQMEVVLISDDETASLHFEHSIALLNQLITSHKGEPRATIAQLFYLEKKSVKEISAIIDINQNTVLSHLRRFRLIVSKAMLQLIEEQGLELN